MGQQVIIVQNKSGGPKVFGIIAIIFGLLGVLNGVFGVGDWDGGLWIVTGMMGIASSGLFIWAGVLLMQYQKKGVWVGFGSVGINLLSGLIFTMQALREDGPVACAQAAEESRRVVAQAGVVRLRLVDELDELAQAR